MAEYLEMGGYGAYIWPCYAMAFFLLVALLGASIKSLFQSKRDLSVMEQIAQGSKKEGQAS